MDNQAFLTQIRNGNPKPLFLYLYGALPSFRRWVKLQGGIKEDANDLFQDVLIIVHKKCLDPDFVLTADPRTFTISVSKFLYQNHLRKRKLPLIPLEYTSEIAAIEGLENLIETEEKYKSMQHAFNQIGDKCMQLLRAFFHHKKSMEEIAIELDFRNATVAKAMKYKCLEKARHIAVPNNQIHEISGKN
jgi:RNA polymerase sigma factor (sigma-70 family)